MHYFIKAYFTTNAIFGGFQENVTNSSTTNDVHRDPNNSTNRLGSAAVSDPNETNYAREGDFKEKRFAFRCNNDSAARLNVNSGENTLAIESSTDSVRCLNHEVFRQQDVYNFCQDDAQRDYNELQYERNTYDQRFAHLDNDNWYYERNIQLGTNSCGGNENHHPLG